MKAKEWFGQAELKHLLNYDPETGVFTWKSTRGRRIAGKKAGWIDKYGYLCIGLFTLNHAAHRLAWLYVHGTWPKGQIDHKNMNPLDNRIENLRDASMTQQRANQRVGKITSTGIKGVSLTKYGTYHARCRKENLGYFKTCEEAAAAYVKRAKEVFGEFARFE